MSDIISSTSMYLTEGSSDKEYHAHLRRHSSSPDLYVVESQNGRRGGTLRTRLKTKDPLDLDQARKVYDKLVASKLKSGYSTDVSGAIFQNAVVGEQFSGFIPQLPQTVRDPAHIDKMLDDRLWLMQEKYDGENRQVRIDEQGQVLGINKRGLVVALPQELADAFSVLPSRSLFSGEIIGPSLYVFDIQELDGQDLRPLAYTDRLSHLIDAIEQVQQATPEASVLLVQTVSCPQQKRRMCEDIRSASREGVVFKRADAAFSQGKAAASLSDQFKWKFTEDCTVRVGKTSPARRSVEVEIDGPDGKPLALGKVSIPSNHDIPAPGDLVCVEYLHLFEEGSLFQAQYKGVRTDCEGPDTLDQFKIKPKQPAPSTPRMP